MHRLYVTGKIFLWGTPTSWVCFWENMLFYSLNWGNLSCPVWSIGLFEISLDERNKKSVGNWKFNENLLFSYLVPVPQLLVTFSSFEPHCARTHVLELQCRRRVLPTTSEKNFLPILWCGVLTGFMPSSCVSFGFFSLSKNKVHNEQLNSDSFIYALIIC